MFMRILKKMVIVLSLVFAAQGCALYVGDDDDFHHSHHYHHGYRGYEHSSLQRDQVAANGMSTQMSDSDGGRK